MITGFNTDIEYDGVVYHVQTEDKGLDSPIILSLVYSGGAILASKRSPYEDLIQSGYSDEALSERLKRQHRLICAAIHTGRLNDLKKMSGRDLDSPATATEEETPEAVATAAEEETPEAVATAEEETTPEVESAEEPPAPALELELGSKRSQEYQPPPPVEAEDAVEKVARKKPSKRTAASYRIAKKEEDEETVIPPPTAAAGVGQALVVRLLDEVEFYSGETATVRVLVTNRDGEHEDPLANVAVSVKVLGTTFRPLIYSLKTQRNGIATVSTQIPRFNSGRAAVLIRATAKDQAAELRCIIHPSR